MIAFYSVNEFSARYTPGRLDIREYPDDRRKCPDCGEPWDDCKPRPRCTLNDPLFIAIPPGQHIHIQCPVHGSHRINGPNVTWC